MTYPSCCEVTEGALVVEYSVGCLDSTFYRVCPKHLQKIPWNKHIVSQKRIGDDVD